tara:strand:+ start:1879 stop:2142 length:264 start_codon:yes stop_codon:yes gene_type:complete
MVKDKNAKLMEDIMGAVRTVHGHCPECGEETMLVSVVTDYYRCTFCGEDTKQYINGSIKYLKLSNEDHEWLRKQKALALTTTKNVKE